MTNDRRRRSCQRSSTCHTFAPCRPGARSFRLIDSSSVAIEPIAQADMEGAGRLHQAVCFALLSEKQYLGASRLAACGYPHRPPVSALDPRVRLSRVSWIISSVFVFEAQRTDGCYLRDVFARLCPVEVPCVARQDNNATGWVRLHLFAVEMFAQADVENAGHDCVVRSSGCLCGISFAPEDALTLVT